MIYIFNSILLQGGVVGDMRVENGGDSMWATPLGVILALAMFYHLFKKEK